MRSPTDLFKSLRIMATAAIVFAGGTAWAAPVATPAASFDPAFVEALEDDYGLREGERLQRDMASILASALERVGAETGATGPVNISVTILDAKPNRPTYQQLRDEPALSYFGSISIGGASLRAEIRDQSGALLATIEDDWYETSIENVIGADTWQDARRAMRMFARKVADAYAALPATTTGG